MNAARPRSLVTLLVIAACSAGAFAQTPKVPLTSDEQGSVYVEPNASSTETSIETRGATVGVQRKDGSATYTGVDTSGTQPAYSVGGSTGGDVSFSAGAKSDGSKANTGVKAGITIKY
jgi:hypothetical protein